MDGPSCQRRAVLHDRPREMRVIGLRDQLDAILNRTDDHFGPRLLYLQRINGIHRRHTACGQIAGQDGGRQ
jgi:hypothetical protein